MGTIEELKRKQLAKERELAALRDEIRKQKRNDEFRQKILLGAVVLRAMGANPEVRSVILPLLEEAVHKSKLERDKEIILNLLRTPTIDKS